jgi:hypothetical protein
MTKRCQSQELRTDGAGQYLSQQRGDSISDLPLGRDTFALNFDIVRERLQAAELANAEAPISPMERANGGSGLGLDRP